MLRSVADVLLLLSPKLFSARVVPAGSMMQVKTKLLNHFKRMARCAASQVYERVVDLLQRSSKVALWQLPEQPAT